MRRLATIIAVVGYFVSAACGWQPDACALLRTSETEAVFDATAVVVANDQTTAASERGAWTTKRRPDGLLLLVTTSAEANSEVRGMSTSLGPP